MNSYSVVGGRDGGSDVDGKDRVGEGTPILQIISVTTQVTIYFEERMSRFKFQLT